MNLKDRAMLVSLHAPIFNNNKRDQQATASTLAANNAASDAGTFVKHLLPKAAYAAYTNAVMAGRLTLYRYSSPWLDKQGTRIMPSSLYFDFQRDMQTCRLAVEAARQAFFDQYDSYIADRTRLGQLYNADDFPSRAKLARRFVFAVAVEPITDSTDWRCRLTADEEQSIKEAIETRLEQAQATIQRDNFTRLHAALSDLVSKLSRYDGTRKGAFRDTLTAELCDLVDLLPALNLTDNRELNDMVDTIRTTICTNTPDALREDESLRQRVLAESDKMLANMSGWLAGDDDDE